MHLAILAAVVLAQVPLPVPYPGGAQDDYQSPIVSLVAWDKGGSADWGAGIPSPTIDCAPLPGSTGGDIVCSGASPTKAGSPTTGNSPFWYRGDAAVRPSVLESGSNYHNLGDVADASTTMTSCVEFNTSSVAGATYIAPKSASNAGYLIYASTTSLVLRVCNGTGCTSGGTVTISAGSWYVACHAYSHALGTIIGNANGVAGTPATSVAGPIADTSADLTIGTAGGAAVSVRRVAIWTGWAADAAQLAQMVATQWGLAADKPAGTVATHARSDSTYCGPFSDAEQFLLGPGAPCIHAPTYQGWASGGTVAGGAEVYGIGQNALGYSFALDSWTTNSGGGPAAPSVTPNTSTAPSGNGAETVAFPAVGAGQYSQVFTSFTGTAARWTWSAWVRKLSGAGSTFRARLHSGTTAEAVYDCPVTSAWTRCYATSAGNLTAATWYLIMGTDYAYGGATSAITVEVADAQATPTAYPSPYRATPGASSYTGTASTATTLTVPVALTDPSRWAIATTLLSAQSTPSQYGQILNAGTAYAANSATLEFHTGGGLYFNVDNSAGDGSLLLAPGLWTTSGPHTVIAARDPTQRLSFDGAWQTLTGTPGTALWSAVPSVITIGGSSFPVPGLYQRLVQGKRAGGLR